MVRVTVKYVGPGKSAVDWFEDLSKKQSEGVSDVIEDAVKRGEQVTKHFIETRGTMKSGKRGRIETGAMRDAVSSEMTEKSKDSARGSFGWIKDFESYFGFQEEGFEHIGGVTVDGMYAISDAGDEIIADVQEDVERVIRDA